MIAGSFPLYPQQAVVYLDGPDHFIAAQRGLTAKGESKNGR